MLIDLRDRVVVVSGAAQGIGRAIAERFLAEGCRVFGLDLRFRDALPEGITAIVADVTDPVSVQAAVARVLEEAGRVDVLVNNAGINVEGSVETLEPARFQAAFDVNVGGVFLLSQAVTPAMKAAGGGRIINAASFAAVIPSVGAAAYGASKAAVVQFTRVLASELGPWGITVNAYAPGMIPTAMNGFAEMPEPAQDRLLDTLSIRRWERPDDVADLLVFLASDRAGYITGTLVDVSGGKLATQMPQRAYEGEGAPERGPRDGMRADPMEPAADAADADAAGGIR
jgi:NAD(P)-dependent dehydrogenase (short-subunit alcohol dehydrogenase family)